MRSLFCFSFVIAVFLVSRPLSAGTPLLWDVAIERDDPGIRQAFADLDVWAAYRDEAGRWHYRVAASHEAPALFAPFAVRVEAVTPLSSVVPPPASEYRDADRVLADLAALETAYPDRAHLYPVGKTIENRDILAVKISTDPTRNLPDKTEILLVAMHHAREWIGVEVLLRMAEFLLEQYDYNHRIRAVVDASEIWIVPMLNEDGYRYSWTKDRYWRKNRRNNSNGTYGVDLNRNYDADWGGEGASKKSASETYCGTAPFSEPETQAIRDLLDPANGFMDDPAGFIDFHSYSQLILYPYGNTEERSPREKEMAAIAGRMADLIFAETGVSYTAMKSSELYVATGASSDWFHLAYDFRNALIIELRPGGEELNGFALPTEEIKETARENAVAVLYFIEATIAEDAEVDTDVNGDGVVDYLDGCGEMFCAMLYDDRGDEETPPDEDSFSPDEDQPDALISDDETNAPDDATKPDDDFAASDTMPLPDDEPTVAPRRASSGGCSIIFF